MFSLGYLDLLDDRFQNAPVSLWHRIRAVKPTGSVNVSQHADAVQFPDKATGRPMRELAAC